MNEYSTYSDSKLVKLLRTGHDAAFNEIYSRYDKLLYLFALRKLEDKGQAKDVVQDVFVALWHNREKLAIQVLLSSYLYKAVVNRILDIFRHQKTVQKHLEQGNHYIDVESQESDYLIREKDIKMLICEEIERMPPRMREIYKLKHEHYWSNKTIATELGISENTVNVQLQRGLKRMLRKFGGLLYPLFLHLF